MKPEPQTPAAPQAAERRDQFTSRLLALFARETDIYEYLDALVAALGQWSGCEAVGIRLKNKQQEIPYESSIGFERGFIEVERCLSLEHNTCICTRAMSGTPVDADGPILTPGGSFRCDNTAAFRAALRPKDHAFYRGNCMGYASLAVIPVRYRDEVIGAIHLADRQPGRFPPAAVAFIEAMTPLIGEAVHRFQTEAELTKYRNRLEALVEQRTQELSQTNARLELEIAQRRRAQEILERTAKELEQSNRDLEQFAYAASHDLQEPLRAVGGYVTLLQSRFAGKLDAKALEFIAGAVDGANRMERLITDLLTFSRVGIRRSATSLTALDQVLDDALINLQARITATHATVTRDPLPELAVDRIQLVQLFQNLIGNALKFHNERSLEIHIGARKDPGRWVFSVRDNGIGIDPKHFDRIFHIFQRLHTRTDYPGTGIGLAICKKIVERHEGAIWVESQLNEGSTFFFSIPEA